MNFCYRFPAPFHVYSVQSLILECSENANAKRAKFFTVDMRSNHDLTNCCLSPWRQTARFCSRRSSSLECKVGNSLRNVPSIQACENRREHNNRRHDDLNNYCMTSRHSKNRRGRRLWARG